MSLTPLSQEAVAELLTKPVTTRYPPPQQFGPVRFVDEELLCIVSGYRDNDGNWIKTKGACRSPTYIKVEGIPTCMMHALRKLNEMLVERGVDG